MNYPDWICHDCGTKYGNRPCGIATWHTDTCDVCGKEAAVTEPRDYGFLHEGWEAERNVGKYAQVPTNRNNS